MPLLKSPRGLRYQACALIYSMAAYASGWALLFSDSLILWPAGVVLLAHGMVIAAYLIHECAHNTIFRENRHNTRLGSLLGWITGSCYGRHLDVRYKHFRHHVDNDDVVHVDYEAWFRAHPHSYRLVTWLESWYIPAHDIMMHAMLMLSSFVIVPRRNQRRRNVLILVSRLSVLGAVAAMEPAAFIGYLVAQMLLIIVLRFMDSLQHDYPYHLTLFGESTSPHKGDVRWEQEHTFSNIISWRYAWPNWLVLNFGFHNAHHAKPTAPWYELPRLHRELFGNDPANVIRLWPQLVIYHRHRRHRIFHDAPGLPRVEGREYLRAAQQALVTGGHAASFLTPF